MAQTARETIYRALRMLGATDPNEVPTATEADNALLALNGMMFGWKAHGADVNHIALAIDDDIELEDEFQTGCTALLAVHLAPEYGKSVSAECAVLARDGWDAILAAYAVNDKTLDMQFDRALLGRHRWGWMWR